MNGALSELDIIVESLDAENQRITVRFRSADAARSVPRQSPPSNIKIDFDSLLAAFHERDMKQYGNQLRDAVLAPDRARTLFGEATSAKPLRVRLHLRAEDVRLHGLHWETMTDLKGAPLSTKTGLAFSRFLPSDQEVTLRPASSALRALVAVANPSEADREKYKVAPIEFEQAQLDSSMGDINYDQLTGSPGPVTMNRLIATLKDGEQPPREGYDILYLVSHGAIVRGDPQLLLALETEAEIRERSAFRSGQKLAERMAEQLGGLPRLVVLASCSGAGHGMDDALYATGPRLAMAGVPAVMAMKGFVDINMVEELLSKFFTAFQETQEVDQAMQAARAHVRFDIDADDWWAPVLFMRLTDGRLASGDGGWGPGSAQQGNEQGSPTGEASGQPPAVEEPAREEAETQAQYPKPVPLNLARFKAYDLYKAMNDGLDLEELAELGYMMGIKLEELKGGSKSSKIREFIEYFNRRKKVDELLEALSEMRSDQDWYADAGFR